MNRKQKLLLVAGGLGTVGAGALLWWGTRKKFDRIVDVRSQAPKSVELGVIPPAKLDTIVLHQMACKDSDPVGWKRWDDLAIHWVISEGPQSKAFLLHSPGIRVAHAHQFNARSVGMEFEGHFSGVGVDPAYMWSPPGKTLTPMVPTPQQVESGKQAIRWTVRYVRDKLGGKIKYIGAHRQSYAGKPNDPGSLIWQKVAIPMMKELNLQEAPTLKDGSPIPELWDPRNKGVPY